MWNWQGRNAEDIKLNTSKSAKRGAKSSMRRIAEAQAHAYATSRSTFKTDAQTGNYVSRVVATDTLRQVVGNHIVDIAVIPWIRSRKVYFKAQGLTPNTKFTPFFDGGHAGTSSFGSLQQAYTHKRKWCAQLVRIQSNGANWEMQDISFEPPLMT